MNIEKLYQFYLNCSEVSTDTRKIKPGSIFFSLKGEKFNANSFAEKALEAGAKYAVIDEAEFKKDERYILVDDVLKTLQQLAKFHRRQLNIPIIGINGSNGKTTTKELFNAVLSKKYKTFSTKGNLNNHIGVPLTLLSIDKTAEIAIIELGANHQEEIKELVNICVPTHGYLTNIGRSHLEGFGGLDGVKKGEGESFDFYKTNNAIVFLNTVDKMLVEMVEERNLTNIITFPQKNNFYSCEFISADPYVKYKDEKGNSIETQLIGSYNFANISAALCAGKYFGVPAEQANEAVLNYIPGNNRSQVLNKNSNIIFLDAYNANPDSMEVAVKNFYEINANKKVIILGDMFELGEESEIEHQKLGKFISAYSFDKILLVGKMMKAALHTNPKSFYFLDKFSLQNWLYDNKFENTHFLIKGSRGMSLETLTEFI